MWAGGRLYGLSEYRWEKRRFRPDVRGRVVVSVPAALTGPSVDRPALARRHKARGRVRPMGQSMTSTTAPEALIARGSAESPARTAGGRGRRQWLVAGPDPGAGRSSPSCSPLCRCAPRPRRPTGRWTGPPTPGGGGQRGPAGAAGPCRLGDRGGQPPSSTPPGRGCWPQSTAARPRLAEQAVAGRQRPGRGPGARRHRADRRRAEAALTALQPAARSFSDRADTAAERADDRAAKRLTWTLIGVTGAGHAAAGQLLVATQRRGRPAPRAALPRAAAQLVRPGGGGRPRTLAIRYATPAIERMLGYPPEARAGLVAGRAHPPRGPRRTGRGGAGRARQRRRPRDRPLARAAPRRRRRWTWRPAGST